MAERVEVLITGDASGLIRTTDQASEAMADFGRSAGKLSGIADALRSDFGRMTGAFAAAQVGVSAVIGAFNQAAAAVQAMNAEVIDAERVASKLIAVFDGAEGAAARLTAQAEALAGSTVFFDDDAIKSAAAALRGFELTEQEISKLLPVAVNLATVFDSDLTSAATKLALGLNGSTKGLREFEIITKEGADRAEIFAQILERGEKAAKGAADAQGGLRGATEGLKKAQGEFNQALGNLLAGPQSDLLNFLTDATNRATGLANSMAGATEQLIKTARVIDPLTGKIVEATGVGGKDLFGPGSLTAQFAGRGSRPAATAPEKKPEERPARSTRRTAERDPFAGFSVMERYRDQARQDLNDEIAAAIEGDKRSIDAAKQARDIRLDAADQAAQIEIDAAKAATDLLAQGASAAGKFLVDVLKGDASLGGFIRSFGGVATGLGAAFGGPIGAALAGIGVEVAAAIADETAAQDTAAQKLGKAGDELLKAGEMMTEAELERRIEAAKAAARAVGLSESEIAKAVAAAKGEPEAAPASGGRRTQSLPQPGETLTFVGGTPTVGYRGNQFGAVGAEMEQDFSDFLLPSDGVSGVGAIVTGGTGVPGGLPSAGLPGAPAGLPAPAPLAPETTEPFRELVRILRELYSVQLDEAGAGMTERQPLYVFDVAAGRDEFTRAPRGLFFRPVGSGRGVDGGQALSGVSSNTTNRRTSRRTG